MNFVRLGSINNKLFSLSKRLSLNTTSLKCFSTSKTKDLLESIKEERQQAEKSIYNKTQEGRKALNVTDQLQYDKKGYFYHKKQNYEVFIERIMEIHKNEESNKRYLDSKNNINMSLKEVLLDQRQPTDFMFERLANIRKAKGHRALAFSDFTTHEIEQSSGMSLALDQLKFNLQPGNFFPPHQIAKVVGHMSEIRYKNPEFVAHVRSALLNRDARNYNEDKDIYAKLMGDLPNRKDTFQGFLDSKEFYSHVETLLNWRSEEEALELAEKEAEGIQDNSRQDVQDIVQLMRGILDASKETKFIQKELAEAIENVRSSFSKMTEAFDQHKFIQDNPYIKHDLLLLQTKLVESGLMLPEEASGQMTFEDLPLKTKMRRANEVFYDLTKDYYPEVAPLTDPILGRLGSEEKSSGATLAQKEAQNELNLKYIGMILGKLSEMRQSVRRDPVPINDYFTRK